MIYEASEDGRSPLTAELERGWDELHGPEPDAVDAAVRTLTAARKIVKDAAMMAAVRKRVEEQRAAVAKAGKERI
jgi:hypothetical protein